MNQWHMMIVEYKEGENAELIESQPRIMLFFFFQVDPKYNAKR